MKLMIPVNCIFVLYALALYWSGEVLDALFWMSVASTGFILSTSIKK